MKTVFRPLILSVSITLVLSACATRRVAMETTTTTTVHEPVVGSVSNVRFGEVVKAYPIERYRDPADPRIMHERHVVYRVEADPAWRLRSNRSEQLIVGNLVTDRRSARSAITSQELTAEVARSRAQNQVISTQQAITVDALGKTNAALQNLGAANEVMMREVAKVGADVKRLKDRAVAEDARRQPQDPAGAVPVVPGAAAPEPAAPTVMPNGTLQ